MGYAVAFVVALGVGIFRLVVINPLAQKILPTKRGDPDLRRVAYRALVAVLLGGTLLLVVVVGMLATDAPLFSN